jgi:transcriptional regulator with XRE-family HTH domain
VPNSSSVPFEVSLSLTGLGERIRTARLRRRISQAELAKSCGISRRTLFGIESGVPGSAVGHVFTVLWALGLLASASAVANPDADEHGKTLAAARENRRARQRTTPSADTNF